MTDSVSVSNMAVLGIQVPKWATSTRLRQFVKSVDKAAGGYREAAPLLGISPNIVWNLIHDEQKDSPILRKRWGIRKSDRIRLSADLDSVEQRDMLKQIAADNKMSWSELCKHWANTHLEDETENER